MLRQPLPCRGIRGNSPLGKPGPVIRKMPCPASVTQHLLAFAALQVLGCSQLHSSLMLSTRPLQRSLVDMALIQAVVAAHTFTVRRVEGALSPKITLKQQIQICSRKSHLNLLPEWLPDNTAWSAHAPQPFQGSGGTRRVCFQGNIPSWGG